MVHHDERIEALLRQFVCVRIIQANALDLAQFQFDFDLSFAAFLMNADGTIYGRFGSRSDQEDAMRQMTMEGFAQALAAALELHRDYPRNKAALAGKKGPPPRVKRPEEYPSLSKYKPTLDYDGAVVQSCMHCHQIREAERQVLRQAKQPFPDNEMFPWPMPDVVGLSLDPKERARVLRVAPGSAAEKGGFRAGDEILTLAGQPILSIADVQWVLHTAGAPARIPAQISREGRTAQATLLLEKGWRRASDISWRVTTWDLRRMATGGMLLEAMSANERAKVGLADNALALCVKHVGEYGEHAAAKRAGFLKGDVLVAFDGRSDFMTESELIAHVLQRAKPAGETVAVTVLRGGRRIELRLPLQ